ncbi:MAG: hypothetical protein MUP85_02880 [Candidatus Lokiarchaeota archaeon]|nr:hypothetical protein [Candidatus Lokiarchaeota archaeon]
MNDFFSVFTNTPWENLNSDVITEVRLLSLKSILKEYPVIEPEFFDDLSSNISKNRHYSWIQSIRRIMGPNKEDYKIQNWNFVWAMDRENRMFQFLFQKIEQHYKSQAVLVGLAPPELGKLFSEYEGDAILRTLSLLNNPSKMQFLITLAPKGKSIAEEQQPLHISRKDLEKIKFVNILKEMPNIQGKWFFSQEPKCPICNGLMKEMTDYQFVSVKLICSKCGYKRKK